MKLYKTIVADPPWPYQGIGPRSSAKHRPNRENTLSILGASSVKRYGSMSLNDLSSLLLPSDENCHLYLWTTNGFMEQAYQVARKWGFCPKTIITWVKVKQGTSTPSMKTGYYFRGASEHVLFCVKGKMLLKSTDVVLPTWFAHERLPHSTKPDYFFKQFVEQASPGPYLEMFARKPRQGWDVFGDQVENSIIIPHKRKRPVVIKHL